MDLVPSFLNNFPAVLNFNKVEEESEPKLKDFVRRIEDVEYAVNNTVQKVESFMSMLEKLDEQESKADDDKDGKVDDEDESSSDDEHDFENANASLLAAESALFEAKRTIRVAEIAYREAQLEFDTNSAKILDSPVESAKKTKDSAPTQAQTSGSNPFAEMLDLTKNFLSIFVSAQSYTTRPKRTPAPAQTTHARAGAS